MGKWGSFLAGAVLAVLALAPTAARAQSGAACPISPPITVNTSTYLLTNNNGCQTIAFTATSPITVVAPNANTVVPGFQVMLIPFYNGLTVTSSSTSTINGITSQSIGAGQSAILIGDGTNYFWGGGSGLAPTPAPATGSGGAVGTNWSNSPVSPLPNAILKIINPASVVQAGDAFTVCRGGSPGQLGPAGQPSIGPPVWWQVLDPLGKPRRIPLC